MTQLAIPKTSTIAILNEGTGARITTTSNADGTFISAALPIGTYTITVTKRGFSTYTEKSVEVHPTQVASVNPQLKVGTVTQQVEVSASAAQVQTSTAEVSSEVSGKEVRTLP